MEVAVLIYPGVDELDAIAPLEVLRMAERMGAPWQVRIATVQADDRMCLANGIEIVARDLDLDREVPDLLVVPGGGWNNRAPQGAWAEFQRGTIPAKLTELHQRGTVLASVCTGAMLLAAAGLLANRHATTHHLANDALREHGAIVTDARVVHDGDIITAGGVTSGLDLALWIVERFSSRDTESKIESRLEYERRGPIWSNGQLELASG